MYEECPFEIGLLGVLCEREKVEVVGILDELPSKIGRGAESRVQDKRRRPHRGSGVAGQSRRAEVREMT